MRFEEFALGESAVHRLDPRVKLIVASVFALVIAFSHSQWAAAVALIFPLVLISAAGITAKQLLPRLALVNAFIAFIWLFVPFTYGGEVAFSIGPLHVYWEGIRYALLITLKSNAIVLTVIALLGTTPVFNLVHALSHMGVPMKLVHIFFFCFRYIHVIGEEYERLNQALKVRNFVPGTNRHTYRTYGYLVGMLLVRSFERSKRIFDAMKCRGFSGRFYILHHYGMKRPDYLVAFTSVAFSAMLLFVP